MSAMGVRSEIVCNPIKAIRRMQSLNSASTPFQKLNVLQEVNELLTDAVDKQCNGGGARDEKDKDKDKDKGGEAKKKVCIQASSWFDQLVVAGQCVDDGRCASPDRVRADSGQAGRAHRQLGVFAALSLPPARPEHLTLGNAFGQLSRCNAVHQQRQIAGSWW